MEPDKKLDTNEPVNGASPDDGADAPADAGSDAGSSAASRAASAAGAAARSRAAEASAAYDRARREMNEAVTRLKREIDNLEMDRAALRAQHWVRDNPALATFLALGGGILVGRLVAHAFTPPPPPPLPVRLRNRALEASRDVGRAVRRGAAVAGGAAAVAGGSLAHNARELGDTIGHHVGPYADRWGDRLSDVGHAAAHRTSAWSDGAGARAHDAAAALSDATDDAADVLAHKAREGADFAQTVFNSVRAVAAAVLVKKVNDLVRRVF